MFKWEKFWYVQSIVAYCGGSLLIFNTFLSFPWSWLVTLTSANLLGMFSGGQKLFTALSYEIPLLAFLQLGCFYVGKMLIVIVAEGSNAASIIFAPLACWRHGYAHDQVVGSLALLEGAVLAFGNGGLTRLGMWIVADKEGWQREMVLHVLTGVGVLHCGFRFRLMHLSIGLRRRRLAVERMRGAIV